MLVLKAVNHPRVAPWAWATLHESNIPPLVGSATSRNDSPVETQYPGNDCGTNGYHYEQQEKANPLSAESFCLLPLD